MSVTMIVQFQAADGKAEPLRALLQQGRDFSLRAEGCEGFDLYQRQNDLHQFVMVQRWTSAEAHDANFGKNVKGSGHLGKILSLTVKPIESAIFHSV